jgi:amidase
LIDAALIQAHAEKAGLAFDADTASMAVELVAELHGAWAASPVQHEGRAAVSDPLNAIACVVDRPASSEGPLSGKTLAVKDNVAVANIATAIGIGLPGFVSDRDATIVARAEASGARIVAKAQCEALLLGGNSFNSRPYPVRNPHDPSSSAGGSSSGPAAMVAAGLCDIALGTDSGGSIRTPSSFCGVVGLKPSRGAVPYTGIAPLAPWLEVAGPMGRNVADVTALFDAIAGPDGIDMRCGWAAKPCDRDLPNQLSQLRIGVLDHAAKDCDPAIQDVFAAAVSRLSGAGVAIKVFGWSDFDQLAPVHLAIYLISDALNALSSGTGSWASDPPGWREWRHALPAEAIPEPLFVAYATGLALHDSDPGLLGRAIEAARQHSASLDEQLERYEAVLLPVTRGITPVIPDGQPSFDESYGDTGLTAPFNATGHPVVSLPIGKVGTLPVGMQIVGQRGSDRRLLSIAALIENALGRLQPPEGDFGSL